MTDLRMMATEFAKEMIEHNLKNGVQVLDKEYIAKDACELAYLIDKNIASYEGLHRDWKAVNQDIRASGAGAAQGNQP